jgi:hypothetical protein
MRADDVLDQIDTCLGDWSVSSDAMRSTPDLPPPPMPSRIVIQVDLEQAAARFRQVNEAIQGMAEACAPAVEAASQALAQFGEAMRQPMRPVGRPAWQTPYGPPQQRR